MGLNEALYFDNTSSKSFGVYITGEAVFNAPERAVEMISIPGRNGTFALDRGHFENIEVTYPAGIYADNESDFADAISDFRNFLCSKKGYCRLADDYNTGEYREAVYKSGLEVSPAQLRAGEFNITFECKPQRFLTSGETAVSLTSGDSITNPTLFDASPLLQIWGYGNANVNGSDILIENKTIGYIEIVPAFSNEISPSKKTFNAVLAVGDDIYASTPSSDLGAVWKPSDGSYTISTMTATNTAETSGGTVFIDGWGETQNGDWFQVYATELGFTYGSSGWVQESFKLNVSGTHNGNAFTGSYNETVRIEYDGANTITIKATGDIIPCLSPTIYGDGITANSTEQIAGSPLYIDCDTGMVYKVVNDVVSSYGSYVALESELPTLNPGSNTITFDNTFTQFKIVPRWWKV